MQTPAEFCSISEDVKALGRDITSFVSGKCERLDGYPCGSCPSLDSVRVAEHCTAHLQTDGVRISAWPDTRQFTLEDLLVEQWQGWCAKAKVGIQSCLK